MNFTKTLILTISAMAVFSCSSQSETAKTDSAQQKTQTVSGWAIEPGSSGIYSAPVKLIWGTYSGYGKFLVEPASDSCHFASKKVGVGNPTGIASHKQFGPYIFTGSSDCQVKLTKIYHL